MPYVANDERDRLTPAIGAVCQEINKSCTPGTLNYILTMLCREYLITKGENYTHINDVIGVLECAKMEYYRRIAVDYENSKIKSNGDVF